MQLLVCCVVRGPRFSCGSSFNQLIQKPELLVGNRKSSVMSESAFKERALVDEPMNEIRIRTVDTHGIHQLCGRLLRDKRAAPPTATSGQHLFVGKTLQRSPDGDFTDFHRAGNFGIQRQLLALAEQAKLDREGNSGAHSFRRAQASDSRYCRVG